MFTLMAVFTSIPAHWLAMSLLWHLVPVRFPMCCCQPYVITTDGAGRELGRSQVSFCRCRLPLPATWGSLKLKAKLLDWFY